MMPSSADPDRINDIQNNGASIQFFDSVPEARKAAIKSSEKNGYVFVSAFNDVEMIEGGGTIAVELLNQLPNIDCLVCGIGALVEEESITLPLIKHYVDDFLIVNDDEIKDSLFWNIKISLPL